MVLLCPFGPVCLGDGIIRVSFGSVFLGVVLLCPFGSVCLGDGIIMSVRFSFSRDGIIMFVQFSLSRGWYYYVRSVQFF